jgi:hypothetical protein
MTSLAQINRIIMPDSIWQEILAHGKRKLAGDYLPGESQGKRAYGIIAGSQNENLLEVARVLPTIEQEGVGHRPSGSQGVL